MPTDVTDPLLWQLAVDVLTAHQPGPDNRCTNLQCADQVGLCTAAQRAQQATRAARATAPQTHHLPRSAAAAVGRASVRQTSGRAKFVGWFTNGIAANATRLRSTWPQRLPRRVPGAALAA